MASTRPSHRKDKGLLALLAAGAAVISLGLVRGSSSLHDYFALRDSREVMRQTVDGLRQENTDLTGEIARLKTSPVYARKVLRDKYHVTDPGEDIVFFAD